MRLEGILKEIEFEITHDHHLIQSLAMWSPNDTIGARAVHYIPPALCINTIGDESATVAVTQAVAEYCILANSG